MNKQSSSLILASIGLKGCALQAARCPMALTTRVRGKSHQRREQCALRLLIVQNNVCAMQYQRSSFVPNSTIQPAFSLLHPLSPPQKSHGSAAADFEPKTRNC
jgi:hypothetical protein